MFSLTGSLGAAAVTTEMLEPIVDRLLLISLLSCLLVLPFLA